MCTYLLNWASTHIDLLTCERSLTKTGTFKSRVALLILAIGLKCVNRMTVAMETGQNLRSAPLHTQNTRHSVIATKRSLEFWKLPIKVWNINYFVLFSPVLFRNFLIMRSWSIFDKWEKDCCCAQGSISSFSNRFLLALTNQYLT